jgi:hypothetical protein
MKKEWLINNEKSYLTAIWYLKACYKEEENVAVKVRSTKQRTKRIVVQHNKRITDTHNKGE